MSRRRKPITALHRAMPRATRIALEELFWYWLRHEAPEHFRRLAFQKYPREFAVSAKRDRQRWLKRHAQDVKRGKKSREVNPLRESGKLERAFLTDLPEKIRYNCPIFNRIGVFWTQMYGHYLLLNK